MAAINNHYVFWMAVVSAVLERLSLRVFYQSHGIGGHATSLSRMAAHIGRQAEDVGFDMELLTAVRHSYGDMGDG